MINWTRLFGSALAIALFGPLGSAAAADPSASGEAPPPPECGAERALEVAHRVQARYESIRDLSADFEQVSRSVMLSGASLAGGGLDEGEPSRGHVVLAKPGRMSWHYRTPEESRMVSDGKMLWIYDVEAEQVSTLPVAEGYLAGAALQFLLGDGKLTESFAVGAGRCERGRVGLDLLPRQAASYERLGLVANPETGDIVETEIIDLLGNRTTIRFSDMKTNEDPPAELFVFEVPEGVEVVDLSTGR